MDGSSVVMSWAPFTTFFRGGGVPIVEQLHLDTLDSVSVEVSEYPRVHLESHQSLEDKNCPLSAFGMISVC